MTSTYVVTVKNPNGEIIDRHVCLDYLTALDYRREILEYDEHLPCEITTFRTAVERRNEEHR